MTASRKNIGCLWILLAFIFLAAVLFLWGGGRFLVVREELKKSDYLVVLSGGKDYSRLDEAARLFNEGWAEFLVITETGAKVPGSEGLFTVESKVYAVKAGVPPTAIVITEKVVDSTAEEARVIKKMMSKAGKKSCIVVTDPFHSRRTRLIFTKAFEGTDMSCSVYASRNSWYSPATWWRSLEGWKITLLEWGKLISYWIGIS